jgi:tRNA threonylcarbamoyladenosine biosynthesis protein TsaE
MKKQVFLSKSAQDTQKLAGQIAEESLGAKERKNAVVLALEGELGGGKTTFVQGLAKALGIKGRVTSPSFMIMRRYKIVSSFPGLAPARPRAGKFQVSSFYHIDCYRVDSPKEILALDFKKIIADPKNIVAIEWADKVKSLIPQDAVWVEFEWMGEEERTIKIN